MTFQTTLILVLGWAAFNTLNAALPETGKTHPALRPFDQLMRRFVVENEIPGAALAVAKDGRLLYARGFGWANRENKKPVQPHSLFRVASISKPITAVAILRLVDQGKLKLDEPAFARLPHKPLVRKDQKPDPRLEKITIRHLLQHRGGWDRAQSMDAMFRPVRIARALGKAPPADANDVIRFMRGWPLDFDPGARYAYSNLGYNILGRVIEQATDRSYEDYVKAEILKPIGVTAMRIGRTLAAGRAKDEVHYYARGDRTSLSVMAENYGQRVPRPYGAWHFEAMDSHGAWIASVIDLVRFGSALEHYKESKILKPASITAMTEPPPGAAGHDANGKPKPVYYGLGWSVRPVGKKSNRWHTGSLDGTAALLVLRHDGLCWAVLFNTRATPKNSHAGRQVDPLLHEAAAKVQSWPDHDLFKK